MKIKICFILLASLSAMMALAQEPNPPLLKGLPPDFSLWTVRSRENISTIHETTVFDTNALTGELVPRTFQVTEVAGGLNYLDTQGQWQESQDLIELMPDGSAAALWGPTKVQFSPNINTPGAITLTTQKGLVLKTHLLGIYYFDAKSGKTALIAELRDATAELLPPNQIVYREAFGPLADVRYTYNKGAFESDVILCRNPQLQPEDFGFDPATTRVEVWHEWLNAPQPKISPRVLARMNDPATRNQMVEPDWIDETLDFGELWFPLGKTLLLNHDQRADFSVAAQIRIPNPALEPNSLWVGKQWRVIDNRSLLIESVPWADLKPRLGALPKLAQADGVKDRAILVQDYRHLPAPEAISSSSGSIQLASRPYQVRGVAFDYTTITGNGGYTFSSGTTYRLTNNNVFNGAVVFSAGAVIKRDSGCSLILDGTVTCNGTDQSPTILTTVNDNMYGEYILTNQLAYSPGPALWIWHDMANTVSISRMKVQWASLGIQFDGDSPSITRYLANALFEQCQTGILAYNCTVALTDVAKAVVATSSSVAQNGIISGGFTSNNLKISLQSHVIEGTTALASLHTLPSGWPIFMNISNMNYSYNSSSWIYGLQGYTSFSPSNSMDQTCPHQGGGVLITPRNVLITHHIASNAVGCSFRFVGSDNAQYVRVCRGEAVVYVYTNSYSDMAVLTLDSDLPETVHRAKLLGNDAVDFIPYPNGSGDTNNYLPCIGCNQDKSAFATDLYSQLTRSQPGYIIGYDNSKSRWLPEWWAKIRSGDSGSSLFILINNELVLIGTWSNVSGDPQQNYGYGRWFGWNADYVNSAIVDADEQADITNHYTVQTADLSAFPSF